MKAHEQEKQLTKPPGAAVVSNIVDNFGTQQPEESTGEEKIRLSTSLLDGGKKTAQDALVKQKRLQSGCEALSPKSRGEGILPPLSLVALLALFLFLCVGAEVGFGAWVAVVVLRDGLSGEANAIRMARCGEEQEGGRACRSDLTHVISNL